jgi:hypothetical protein
VLFVIGMLAAVLIWMIVIGAVVWLLYRFFKWSLTILWRALNYRMPFREAQLNAREEELASARSSSSPRAGSAATRGIHGSGADGVVPEAHSGGLTRWTSPSYGAT